MAIEFVEPPQPFPVLSACHVQAYLQVMAFRGVIGRRDGALQMGTVDGESLQDRGQSVDLPPPPVIAADADPIEDVHVVSGALGYCNDNLPTAGSPCCDSPMNLL
jgi:hypothetical protein